MARSTAESRAGRIPGGLRRLASTRPRSTAVFLAGILIGASVGLASGAIPATGTGVFYACYDSGGNLKLLDNATTTTCPKGFKGPVTWNQTGPQGLQGHQGIQGPSGAQGPQGEPGDSGTASLASLAGSDCSLPSGIAGTVTIGITEDGSITLTCSRWCLLNTPTVGAHMTATCDETGHIVTFTCDPLWVDVNHDIADGCERSYGQAAAELLLLGEVDVTVPSSCGGTVVIGCAGGVPVVPPPQVHLSGTSVVADEVVGASRFNASATIQVQTLASIPISAFGTDCTFSIDTAHGAQPYAQVFVPINFVADGASYDIVLGAVTLVGLDVDDIAIGGGIACQAIDFSLALFLGTVIDTITDAIRNEGQLCIVPEPDLVARCP